VLVSAAKSRLESSARRDQLIASALGLFARDGLHGVTTKAIAAAAGVSEALIFRHFPTKEVLFDAVLSTCVASAQREAGKLTELEPSTRTLVTMVYFLTNEILFGESNPHHASIKRLLLKSFAGDGEFARAFFHKNVEPWLPICQACFRAAYEAGDILESPDDAATRMWFSQHAISMTAFMHLHSPPLVRYGKKERELSDSLLRFVLRGGGLTPAAIRRELAPDRLAESLAQVGVPTPKRGARRKLGS
jgi:AcrR family transcriptional regulator